MGKLLGDYTEARTLFAFMFYATFCYLVLKHVDVPPELNTIVSSLMGYWFGVKSQPKTQADEDKTNGDQTMKKVVSLLILSIVLATPVFAKPHSTTIVNNSLVTINEQAKIPADLGIKLDAPNLVKLPANLALGIEGGKSTYDNNSRQGYFLFGKLSWTGSLLDLSGKK